MAWWHCYRRVFELGNVWRFDLVWLAVAVLLQVIQAKASAGTGAGAERSGSEFVQPLAQGYALSRMSTPG